MLSNEEPKVNGQEFYLSISLGRHLLSPPVYPQTSLWEGIYCLLHPYTHRHLSEKTSTVFSTRILTDICLGRHLLSSPPVIPTDKQNDYEIVKTVLLDAFEVTVDMARLQWWILRKTADESFQNCMIRIEKKFKIGLESCSTHFDYITLFPCPNLPFISRL